VPKRLGLGPPAERLTLTASRAYNDAAAARLDRPGVGWDDLPDFPELDGPAFLLGVRTKRARAVTGVVAMPNRRDGRNVG